MILRLTFLVFGALIGLGIAQVVHAPAPTYLILLVAAGGFAGISAGLAGEGRLW